MASQAEASLNQHNLGGGSSAAVAGRRPHRSPEEVWRKLREAVHHMKLNAGLSTAQCERLSSISEMLITKPNRLKQQKYRTFLTDVLRGCGPGAVVLCGYALGQRLFDGMRNNERTSLTKLLEDKKYQTIINDPMLRQYASDYRIPNSIDGMYGKRHHSARLTVQLDLYAIIQERNRHTTFERQESSAATRQPRADRDAVSDSTQNPSEQRLHQTTRQQPLAAVLSKGWVASYPVQVFAELVRDAGQNVHFIYQCTSERASSYRSGHIGPGPAKFHIQLSQEVAQTFTPTSMMS